MYAYARKRRVAFKRSWNLSIISKWFDASICRKGPKWYLRKSEKQYRNSLSVIPEAYVNNRIIPCNLPFNKPHWRKGNRCRIIHGPLYVVRNDTHPRDNFLKLKFSGTRFIRTYVNVIYGDYRDYTIWSYFCLIGNGKSGLNCSSKEKWELIGKPSSLWKHVFSMENLILF